MTSRSLLPHLNPSLALSIPFMMSIIFVNMVSIVAEANPRGPLFERDPSAVLCEYPDDSLSGEVRLDSSCYYEQAFVINQPDTTLDCQGAELRGSGEYLINIKRRADRATVKNCYLKGGRGLAVRARQANDDESPDEVRAIAPIDVMIHNVQISDSEGVGAHFHVYTLGVTIRDSVIINNSSAGVYLSPYGKGHLMENNTISGNGHLKPDGSPRLGWYRREGIAVDASSEHRILNNDIIDNAFGGILLYKNCWEHAESEPGSRPRIEHARANLIQGNLFSQQPFGVWVASRQSRDLRLMECGDPTPYDNPLNVVELLPPVYQEYPSAYYGGYLLSVGMASVWPDFAEENMIIENRFEHISLGGIRVEDDETEITENLFVGDFDYIFLGAPFRALLNDSPVMNTLIRGNAYVRDSLGADELDTSFTDYLALMPDEHEGTMIADNHQACLLNSEQVILHGELTPSSPDHPCGEITLQCAEGSFLPYGEDSSCLDTSADDDYENGRDEVIDHNLLDQGVNEPLIDEGFDEEPSLPTEERGQTTVEAGCIQPPHKRGAQWPLSLIFFYVCVIYGMRRSHIRCSRVGPIESETIYP